MSSNVQRVREYATSDTGKGHAKVGGIGALAGAVAVMIPTLPTLWSDHEERNICESALALSHQQNEALAVSYDALVERVSDYFMGIP